jgi:hypothetical protein
MSFNLATKINNLQVQVNNIANKGLTNPLEQIMNANSYALTNLSVLNGNANTLNLQSSSDDGIQTNCDITVGGNLTCNTLNYTHLNPEVDVADDSIWTLGVDMEFSNGVFSVTGDGSNSYSYPNVVFNEGIFISTTIASGCTIFGVGLTPFPYGTTNSNPVANIKYGFSFSGGNMTQIINGSTTGIISPPSYPCNIGIYYDGISNIKLYVGEVLWDSITGATTGFYSPAIGGYGGSCSNFFYSAYTAMATITTPNIGSVLTAGNNAGNLSITALNDVGCSTITCSGTTSCSYVTTGNMGIILPTRQIYMATSGFSSGKLSLTADGGTTVGAIYDSYFTQPVSTYRKIINGINTTITGFNDSEWIFSLDIPQVLNNSVTYVRFDMGLLNIRITPSAGVTFPNIVNFTVFLASTNNATFPGDTDNNNTINLSLTNTNNYTYTCNTTQFLTLSSSTNISTIYFYGYVTYNCVTYLSNCYGEIQAFANPNIITNSIVLNT